MLVDINGTAVHLERVNYPEKITYTSNNMCGLRLVMYSGAELDISFGYNKEKRDKYYSNVIEGINIIDKYR